MDDEGLPIPTREERTSAMLAHILQIFGNFFAPLIIFLVKRDSYYVRFHALQVLLWQASLLILMMLLMFGFFAIGFTSVFASPSSKEPPFLFIFLFPLVWLAMIGQWIVTIFLAVYFSIRCSEGRWAKYPLFGKLALRWSQKLY